MSLSSYTVKFCLCELSPSAFNVVMSCMVCTLNGNPIIKYLICFMSCVDFPNCESTSTCLKCLNIPKIVNGNESQWSKILLKKTIDKLTFQL